MKWIFKSILFVWIAASIVIQFIPTARNQSELVPKADFLLANDVPKSIGKLLKVSCYDCHSNNTAYPWYNKIQPLAWFLENHIKKGKDDLNFSDWDEYSNRRKNSKLESIISQIEDDEMPPFSYTLIHTNAVLSNSEKEALIDYMKHIKDKSQ